MKLAEIIARQDEMQRYAENYQPKPGDEISEPIFSASVTSLPVVLPPSRRCGARSLRRASKDSAGATSAS